MPAQADKFTIPFDVIDDRIDGLYRIDPGISYNDDTDDIGVDAHAMILLSGCVNNKAGSKAQSVEVILPDTGTYVDRMHVLHIGKDCTYQKLFITIVSTETPAWNFTYQIVPTTV